MSFLNTFFTPKTSFLNSENVFFHCGVFVGVTPKTSFLDSENVFFHSENVFFKNDKNAVKSRL